LAGHHDALWRVTVQPPLVSADAVARYLEQAAEQAARDRGVNGLLDVNYHYHYHYNGNSQNTETTDRHRKRHG
jgi:hypothetical protein